MFTKVLLSIGALLAIAFIILVIIGARNEQEVDKIWRSCFAHATRSFEALPTSDRFTENMVAELPAPVPCSIEKRYI
jgi:hypothetical protein